MYIAIDVGGTNIRVSGFKSLRSAEVSSKVTLRAQDNQPYDVALTNILEAIKQIAGREAVAGVGVSVTGGVNPVKKYIRSSDAYPEWEGKSLSGDLGKELSCKHSIENDAVCAGLGEKFMGKGKDFQSMGFIIVGTGVGAVRVHMRGDNALVYPTEFGHIPIIADGEKCICGQRGCIEAYASGKGLLAFYNQTADQLVDREAWVLISQHMTQALMNFLVMDYVETFIFGGGVALNQASFIDKLLKNIEQMMMARVPYELPEFQTSGFMDDAGSIGSLMLLREDLQITNMNYL